MFAEVKAMLPVDGDDYDEAIIMQINAAALDLTTSAEIVLPGVISIKRTLTEQPNPFYEPGVLTESEEPETIWKWVITDNSTVKDSLITTAIGLWCNMMIGNPPNYDNLRAAYKSLKGQMRMSKKYTRYGGTGR